MTPIDWAAVGAIVSASLTAVGTAAVKWIVPGFRALQQQQHHAPANGERRSEARDFGIMLERLANLAELNAASQAAVAQDREEIRDSMRKLGAQADAQTKALEKLVDIAEAALVASTANGKVLQSFQEAGAIGAIKKVLKKR